MDAPAPIRQSINPRIHSAPSRGGLLPARPPLRTVLESFPSYGSSPHKAKPVRADPRLNRPRPSLPSNHLAILGRSLNALLLFQAAVLRRINRRASVVICFLSGYRFRILSCHFRPDRRGHIQRITAGLGFFGLPKAVPPDPPCGEVRRSRGPDGAGSFSMFCKLHRMI
jgi:hypothetical protein